MGKDITSFKGEYDFLSNFYPVIIQFEGLNYPTVEHAYQASKSKEFFFRKLIVALPAAKAGLAKRRGQSIRLRSDWDDVKLDIMHELLCNKFKQEPFKTKLIATGDAKIIEGNYWHDNTWGDCMCDNRDGKHPECKTTGSNWLGRLLSDIRSQVYEKGYCYRRHTQ